MDQDTVEQERLRELFGYGRAGEPVPVVDPADMKVLWDMGQDLKKRHPEGGAAVGMGVMQSLCKPGANVTAVSYRANMMGMLQHVAPELINPLIQDKLDKVLAAASEIPLEWLGGGVRQGFPFDVDDFVRRVREA
jgi:hypothetical protein